MVAIGRFVSAAGDDSIVVNSALWVRLKVHVAGCPVLRLCKLSLRTIILDFLRSRCIPKFDAFAASENAERAVVR